MDFNESDHDMEKQFFELGEIKEEIANWRDKYYNLDKEDYLESYEQATGADGKDLPIDLDVFFVNPSKRGEDISISYNITRTDLGPFEFDDDKFREFLGRVTHLRTTYRVRHTLD